jgi:hypothetical protein
MRLKVQEVDAALREAMGNRAAVARRFGVTRQAVDAIVKRTPSLQATMNDIEEGMLDNAESSLYREVIDGNFQAVKWYLATKGKARGYVERQEVSGPDGGPIVFTAADAAAAEARARKWRETP